jgi:hypothetical protein
MDRWIVIHNWPAHQHYKDRDPNWIKDYVSQLAHDDYRQLSFHLRGILENLRLAYASSNGRLPADTRYLTRQLGNRVMTRDLEALNHAGFIEIVASRPLALARSREKRREEKKEVANAKTAKPPATNERTTVNMPPRDEAAYVRKLIANHVVTQPYELDAFNLPDALRAELRALL